MARQPGDNELTGPSVLNLEKERAERAMQTDITILKNQQDALKESIGEVNAKLDILVRMQIDIVKLGEQHNHSQQAIDRAFQVINEHGRDLESTESKISAVDLKVNKASNMFKGGMAVAGVLYAIIQYMALQQIDQTKWLTQQANLIDRRVLLLESRINNATGVGPRGRAEE